MPLGGYRGEVNSPRYRGASLWSTVYVSTAILNWIRSGTRSQCRLTTITMMTDTGANFRDPATTKRSPSGDISAPTGNPDGRTLIRLSRRPGC